MKEYAKILLGVIFIISLFSVSTFSSAEMQIQTQEDEIIVDMSPKNPQPYEDVTINLTSYATDLNKSIITWQMDSKIVLTGIGKTEYSFKAQGPNSKTNINIVVQPVNSTNTITKKILISPSEVELLWESVDGYTPPFYKGKTLLSRGGTVKAVAIPNTNTIKLNNGNMSYTWKNNDDVVQDASGYNKDSFTFTNDLFDSENNITVTSSSVNGDYNAENTINIPSYDPEVIFYKKSPTEGVLYNRALDENSSTTENEITLVAEPYFLAIKGNENDFTYNWTINGNPIETPGTKKYITIRPSSRGGYANIDVIFEDINKLFQKVEGQLKLTL